MVRAGRIKLPKAWFVIGLWLTGVMEICHIPNENNVFPYPPIISIV